MASYVLSDMFKSPIKVSSAFLDFPLSLRLSGIQLYSHKPVTTNQSVINKIPVINENPIVYEKPAITLESAKIDLSPLELLFQRTPVSSLVISSSSLAIEDNETDSFGASNGSQAKLLFKLLNLFNPARAEIQSLKTTLSTPLLPGIRKFDGPVVFKKHDDSYLMNGILRNKELTLQAKGILYPTSYSGTFNTTLSTRGKKTSLATDTTGESNGRFRYDGQVKIHSDKESKIEVALEKGIASLKPLQIKLPLFADRIFTCQYATVKHKPSLFIKKSLFQDGDGGTSFSYEGPVNPSHEFAGKIVLNRTKLIKFIETLDGTDYLKKLPPAFSKALIDGTFDILGDELSMVSGRVNLYIPSGTIEGIDIETVISANLGFSDKELQIDNGVISGMALSDYFNGTVNLKTRIGSFKIRELFTTTDSIHSLISKLSEKVKLQEKFNEMLGQQNGNIVLSANLNIPLEDLWSSSGRLGIEITGTEKNKPLFPLKKLTGLDLCAKSAGIVFDFNDETIKVRKFRALGDNFDYIDIRGEHDFTNERTNGDFVVAGLNKVSPGFRALTGSFSRTDNTGKNAINDILSFNLLCDNDRSFSCHPEKNGNHTIQWKTKSLSCKITGKMSIDDLMSKTPPKDEIFQIALKKGNWSFKGAGHIHTIGRIGATGSEVHVILKDGEITGQIKDGSLKNNTVTASLEKETTIVLNDEMIQIAEISLINSTGGKINLSATATTNGDLKHASIRMSDLFIAPYNLPDFRTSGSIWVDNKSLDSIHNKSLNSINNRSGSQNDLKIHGGLILIPEDYSSPLKAGTLLVDYENEKLTISKLKIRTKEGFLSVTGELPLHTSIEQNEISLASGDLNLELISKQFNLNHINGFFNSTIFKNGFINGNITLKGTTKQPQLEGKFTAKNTCIDLPEKLGLIDNLQFDGFFTENALNIQNLTGNWNKSIKFANTASVFSNISFTPHFTTHIASSNTSVTKENLKMIGINFAGDFSFAQGLKGILSAKKLSYKTINSSADTEDSLRNYVLDASPLLEPSFPLDLTIDIPRAIHLRNSSFDSEFGGKITLTKPQNGHSSTSGNFKLLRGNFYLQGQRFKLNKGHLTFRRTMSASFDDKVLPLPLPQIYIKGEGKMSGIKINMSIGGNPLIKNGMKASLDSERTDHTEGDIFALFTKEDRGNKNIASPLFNELSYQLFSTPIEETLGKVLPFDTVRIGGNLTLDDDYTPTILMGKYLGPDLHVDIEGDLNNSDNFWQQFAIDFSPQGSNVKLSFAKDLSGLDKGDTTMAFDYSIHF